MKISYKVIRIELIHPFGISRSSHNWYDRVIIYLEDNDIIGIGEAAPSPRYNESVKTIISILEKGIELPKHCNERKIIWKSIISQIAGIKSLEAAFNMALWDWWGKKVKKPVYEIFGLGYEIIPETSITIAIGDMNDIEKKIEEADSYPIIKVKLGTLSMDKKIIKEIRRCTDKPIRVDANEGWEEENAISLCNWLVDQNVVLIEQPFPAEKLELTSKLRKISPIDIYADENSVTSKDIPIIQHAFDGINIKLMKCGTLEEADKMITISKKYGLKVMLGCMVETSVGITAISQLAGKVDCLDLDGNLLINNDPYKGVRVENGKMILPKLNGLGIELTNNKNLF